MVSFYLKLIASITMLHFQHMFRLSLSTIPIGSIHVARVRSAYDVSGYEATFSNSSKSDFSNTALITHADFSQSMCIRMTNFK